MSLGVNVDPRWEAGRPSIDQVRRNAITWVRMTSLPENEDYAAECLANGARTLAIYTGESDNGGKYVLRAASAIQVGNEPQFAMNGDASWPTGGPDDMVNVWNHVTKVLIPSVHPGGIPLVGPGIWDKDFQQWALVAGRLQGISAAAVHVYPGASGHTLTQTRAFLAKYRAVRADLPLLCTEWRVWGDQLLATARAIDTYCDHKFIFAWSDGVPGHGINGKPDQGVLALAA